MASALDGITFHEKLGTQKERVERIAELASRSRARSTRCRRIARRAAQLAKADLVSGMVGEFPELQGLMGRYYAEPAGTKPEIARAIELHYKPKGPTDTVPREEEGDAVAVAVALADKLDTLVGFWAIGEKPTGSGDPYQLRRAALGVIRIVLENDLRFDLWKMPRQHCMRPLEERSCVSAGSRRSGGARIATTSSVDSRDLSMEPYQVSGLALLLRRSAEGSSARQGRAARSHRRRVLVARPGRPGADRQARRGAGRVPEDRRRRQPAGRRQARHQHPPRRGEEGQEEPRRRRRSRAAARAAGEWRSTRPSRR